MDPGKRWWWVAYTDESLPKGERSLGVAVVQAGGGFSHAARHAFELGLQPAGDTVEPMGGVVMQRYGDPPASHVNRHLSNEEAAELARTWLGGVASRVDIAEAFCDDDAKEGDPLFRGRK